MRRTIIAPNEYYHIFNRGNNKQLIFHDNNDRKRFLFLILCFQASAPITKIHRYFGQHSMLAIPERIVESVINNRMVGLANFVLMPNHFHLTVYELEKNGISKYMQRVLNAYTKYFNTKYEKSGHLFQGPYQAIHIKNNEQLLYLSAYIHRNPREIKEWKNKESIYPWSSYQDYVEKNRWGELLTNNIIIEQFSDGKEYVQFIEHSGAKTIFNEKFLID